MLFRKSFAFFSSTICKKEMHLQIGIYLFLSQCMHFYASIELSLWSTKRLETGVLCFCLSWKYLHLRGMCIYIMHSMLFSFCFCCTFTLFVILMDIDIVKQMMLSIISLLINSFFADLLNHNCHTHHHSWRQQEVPVPIHWNPPLRMILMRNQRSPKRRKRKKA